MNKKLKLFGLLALTLALGAGAAWAFAVSIVLSGENNNATHTLTATDNVITGNGSLVGSVTGMAAIETLQLNAAAGNTVTLAPANRAAPLNRRRLSEAATSEDIQLLVNFAEDNTGTVIVRASNGDNPGEAGGVFKTQYDGGTILYRGTLGVTNNNSLGQSWVGAVANPVAADSPVFRVQDVDVLQLGVRDPQGFVTTQPFFLFIDDNDNTPGSPELANQTRLTYATFEAPNVVDNLQGLRLHHGLTQRSLTRPDVDPAGADTLGIPRAAANNGGFARLIKTGQGMLWINGDTANLNVDDTGSLLPVDGAHHRGGTEVREGTLQVDGGNAAVDRDSFRGSLGRFWNGFNINQAGILPSDPYNPNQYIESILGNANGTVAPIYNPLRILGSAGVIVNRSQFFSDFNTEAGTTFEARSYTLAGNNRIPQVTVTLDGKHSRVQGILRGRMDLVLLSSLAANRPNNPSEQPGLTEGQSMLFLDNASNDIFAEGETIVANGVLQIAGARSIGGGLVTVGANRGALGLNDHGFSTPANNLGTFAASRTLRLPNRTITRTRGALAADFGAELSFSDITVNGNLRLNPIEVDPNVPNSGTLPTTWEGVIAFGAALSTDATYAWAGNTLTPNAVDVERGTWKLNSFPTPTPAQVTSGQTPFADVNLWQTATLSLADGVRDFSRQMDLTITDDSRIRVVVRSDDIVHSRSEAMAKDPIFKARRINYADLRDGPQNKDRRLGIQLDISQLSEKVKKGDWIKVVGSESATGWNNLHYLRDQSTTHDEDYAKVRVGFYGADGKVLKDMDAHARAHMDEHGWSIMVEVTQDFDGTVPTPTPPAVEKDLKADIKAPAEVKLGTDVTFELGKWTYKASADVEVQDVKWMLDGVDKTADVKDSKLTVKAEKEGTMNLVVTSKLKADPTVDGEAKVSVAVKKDGGSSSSGGSSGGCDAGFAGLALLLAAPLFLRKRD